MKPLVLALAVALFATLLNLVVSAGTDAGMELVESVWEYEKRQFPGPRTLACTTAVGWENVDSASAMLENLAKGNNDQGQIIPLGTPTIMFKKISSNEIKYCKYVPGGYAGPEITTMEGKSNPLLIYNAESHAFYARKAADSKPNTIMETAVEMLMIMEELHDTKMYLTFMVEITATGEVYVGPMSVGKPY